MRRLSQEQIKRILKLREEGRSYQDIVSLGFSYYAVSRYCSGYRPELKHIAYTQTQDEIKVKVTQLRRLGLTCREIADKTVLSEGTVKKICKELCPGLKHISRQKFKQTEIDGMIYYHRNGFSMARIGRMFKCNRSTVFKILHNYYKNLRERA